MRKTKLLGLIGLYCSSLLFYLFQGGRSSILLFGILNALLLYLFLYYMLGIRKLSGSRQLGEDSGQLDRQYMAGQSVAVHVSLQHSSIIPMSYMQIEDTIVRHDGKIERIQGTVTPNLFQEVEWTYQLNHLKRGTYQFQQLACSTFDVFGFVEYKRTIHSPDYLQVLPKIMSDINWEQLLGGSKGRYHLHSYDHFAKESNQQSGIRDYVYGDRLSRVHWNATARTGQWRSKDYEKEAMPKGIVILDLYCKSKSLPDKAAVEQETFEELVSIAASLLHYGMEQQQLFTLLSPGRELWSSSNYYGSAAYWQAMKHLITVEANSELPLSILLQRAVLELPLGSTLMIVTSDVAADMAAAVTSLKQKGYLPIIFYTGNERAEREQTPRSAAFTFAGVPIHDLSQQAQAMSLKVAGGEG